jgi:hypothetical protein
MKAKIIGVLEWLGVWAYLIVAVWVIVGTR